MAPIRLRRLPPHTSFVRHMAVLLGLLALSAAPLAAQGSPRVTLHLVPADSTAASSPVQGGSEIQLDTTRTRVSTGGSAKTLLAGQGFVPDEGALAWLYSVNPAVRHLDSLAVGTELLLPVAPQSAELQAALQAGGRLRITLSPTLRAEAETRIVEATEAAAQLDTAVRRADPQTRRAAAEIERATGELARIDLSSAPVTDQVLSELAESAAYFQTYAAQIQKDAGATRGDVARLVTARRAIERVAADVESGGAVSVPVTITLVEGPAHKASGVRLYYATQNNRDRPECKQQRTSPCRIPFQKSAPKPSTVMNATGDFVVWAEKDGQVVSCDLDIKPRVRGDNSWDLQLASTATCAPKP